jgi:hypothetical protein
LRQYDDLGLFSASFPAELATNDLGARMLADQIAFNDSMCD